MRFLWSLAKTIFLPVWELLGGYGKIMTAAALAGYPVLVSQAPGWVTAHLPNTLLGWSWIITATVVIAAWRLQRKVDLEMAARPKLQVVDSPTLEVELCNGHDAASGRLITASGTVTRPQPWSGAVRAGSVLVARALIKNETESVAATATAKAVSASLTYYDGSKRLFTIHVARWCGSASRVHPESTEEVAHADFPPGTIQALDIVSQTYGDPKCFGMDVSSAEYAYFHNADYALPEKKPIGVELSLQGVGTRETFAFVIKQNGCVKLEYLGPGSYKATQGQPSGVKGFASEVARSVCL